MRKILLLLAAPLILQACASTPDPVKVCSAEWIAPRVERHMADFEKNTRKIFRTFEKTAKDYSSDGKVKPLQMFAMMNSLKSLKNKFENGRAMKDMRTLATTCDDPELIKNAMIGFLRKKGFNDRFIQFLNDLEQYKKLLEIGIKQKANQYKT